MPSAVDAILSGDSKKTAVLYELLGCSRDSSTEQITTEYKARVRSTHPDKIQGEEEAFVKLKLAYETLADPSKRRVYDLWLDSPLPYSFEEFAANQEAIRQAMHWVAAPRTQMIKPDEKGEEKKRPPVANSWKEQDRYQSDAVRKFREYKV